jgi:large subunit ribosomal protein L31e
MKEEPIEEEPVTEEEPAEEKPAGAAPEEATTDQETEEILEEETPEEAAEPEEAEEAEAEEEAKPRRRKKEEEEEEIVEERVYTIPLQKALIRPPKKRAPRAMHMIREFITKHMKLEMRVEEEEEKEELPKLVLSKEVNEKVWSKGIEKPPRKIRVRAAKDKDGNVTVYLAEGE